MLNRILLCLVTLSVTAPSSAIAQTSDRIDEVIKRAENSRAEAEQAQAEAEQSLLWLFRGPNFKEFYEQNVRRAAENAKVPRAMGSLPIAKPAGGSFDIKANKTLPTLAVICNPNDPVLDIHIKFLDSVSKSVRTHLILLGGTKAERDAVFAKAQPRILSGSAELSNLRVALQQSRIFSGVYLLIDHQGTVRHQGTVPAPRLMDEVMKAAHLEPLKRERDALLETVKKQREQLGAIGAQSKSPIDQQPMVSACMTAYRDFAISNNRLDELDEEDNKKWCNCVVRNLGPVMTTQERKDFMENPVGFIRMTRAATPGSKPVWRLYQPTSQCVRR